MPVIEVKSNSEFVAALSNQSLVVVDFYAVWCGPCKMLAPKLEEYSSEFPEVKFLKVDVDNLSEVAAEHGITAMPTVKFFKGGKQVDEVVGMNINAIHSKIAQLK
ncbi:hypothetical protein BB561_002966 [Smittium simulii]|uniref:Thioredoxin n=1 Tax=Smittium simulii TaxID=133385 RepID=A0A2T9YNJ3_9FUNG|nr:hypothetical protein BB561_002966 [Smittium simulii]